MDSIVSTKVMVKNKVSSGPSSARALSGVEVPVFLFSSQT